MKAKRWVYKSDLYSLKRILTATEADTMNLEHIRACAEADDSDYEPGDWLMVNKGYVVNLTPDHVKEYMIEVEIDIIDPTEYYAI